MDVSVDGGAEPVEGPACRRRDSVLVEEVCEPVAEQAAVHPGEVDGQAQPMVGDGVAVSALDAGDQPVQASRRRS